ncbi:unnamed protein product [Caenorhabditis sp. 36 PRJEB53466]|nr:unnamed protein product [Caenorhabditis sp. 36 PRJEB53466]
MTAELEDSSPLPAMDGIQENQRKEKSSNCAICREEGDGYHFGAEACRACAAFFRRSVSLGKKYLCRGNGSCEITAKPDIRCMCRACRYSKCLEVGMNPAGVQQRRDTIGKRDMTKAESMDSPDLTRLLNSIREIPTTSSPCPPTSDDLPQLCKEQMSILVKMRTNYRKMDNARLVIHRKDGQSLFKEKFPKAVNYMEAADQGVREVSLVADWIAWCFDDFVALPIDQKKVLFQNFYPSFTLLEGSFLCHINKTSNAVILPSGDYIDMENLDKFFFDPNAEQPMTGEEIEKCCRMFKPSFELHRRCLILPMMAENIDVYEFFALCTLVFWDFGLTGQSDECINVGKSVKHRLMKELAFYLRYVKKIEEPAIRVASMLTLLPALQRSVRRFQEDIEITHVFNIYAPPEEFYNLVNGKFC